MFTKDGKIIDIDNNVGSKPKDFDISYNQQIEWLYNNAYKYGFYLKGKDWKSKPEYWHWEYHGTSAACMWRNNPVVYNYTIKDIDNNKIKSVVKNPKGMDGKEAVYNPDSCESYLQKHLLAPLSIPQDRYLTFDPNISNLSAECARVEQEMEAIGPIDICILGLGKNGHIAFNEPADYLQRGFHKAILAPSTTQHDPTLNEGKEPAFGLCLGMSGIMQSKRIIFLVTGKGKQEAIKMILERKITTQWPASFLWMHGNVDCLIDRNSL
jgi:hypothetical protein